PRPKRSVIFKRQAVRNAGADLAPIAVGSDLGELIELQANIRMAEESFGVGTERPEGPVLLEREQAVVSGGDLAPVGFIAHALGRGTSPAPAVLSSSFGIAPNPQGAIGRDH